MEIKHEQSYSINSKSEFLTNIVIEYLLSLNEDNGIFPERSIFGKCAIVSNTELPTKRSIVISPVPRNSDDGFQQLNIDDNVPEITFIMHGQNNDENYDKLKYIKQKLKRKEPEIQFYLTSAILGTGLDTQTIDRVIDTHYKGIHTATERYQTLIDFILSPSETSLYRLLNVFNDDNYQQLINTISTLTNDTPDWIITRFGEQLRGVNFTKTLLKLALIILKARDRDEFILSVLKGVIYE